MSYEVLARKWRPQQFDQVVGQGHVTQTLKNAITSGRIANAYLFVGPRGVGKTTLARIMAKALNCEKGSSPTPCDACDSCREIANGTNLDVMEIDGASNTQVEHARDIRDNVRYGPTRGKFKIYIIDEVHMLTIHAFNALLKTLEEPPAYVKFIFATTEPHKVPVTILSRCQRFDLRRISTRDIVMHLGKIAAEEKIEIDEDALLALARGAEGALRDAESALDQLVSFCGHKIGENDVLSVFGLVSRKSLEQMVMALLQGDVAAALATIAELDASGKDFQRLSLELLDYFRNLLVMAYAGNVMTDHDLPDAQVAVLKQQAAHVDAARLLRMADALTEIQGQLRYAVSRRTVLEMALVRSARAAQTVSVDEILVQLNKLKAALASGEPSDSGATVTEAPSMELNLPMPENMDAAIAQFSPARNEAPAPRANETEWLAQNWHGFVDRVGAYAVLAKGYLRDARPVDVRNDRVLIGFDPEFASSRVKIDVPRNVKAIQKVLEEMLNRQLMVEFTVLESGAAGPATRGTTAQSEAPTGNTSKDNPPASPGNETRTAKTRHEWTKDPAVRKALETFNGDVVDVRD